MKNLLCVLQNSGSTKKCLKCEKKLFQEISIQVKKITIFFLNSTLAHQEVYFILGAIKSCAKESYLRRSESQLKNMSLNYEKSVKEAFDFSI